MNKLSITTLGHFFIYTTLIPMQPLDTCADKLKLLATIANGGQVKATNYTADSEMIAIGGYSPPAASLKIYKKNDTATHSFGVCYPKGINALTAHPKKKDLACSSAEETYIWDINACKQSLALEKHGFVNSLQYSSNGGMLLSGNAHGICKLWDLRAHNTFRLFKENEAEVAHATLSPDDLHIATCCEDETVRVWDVRTNKLVYSINPKRSVHRATYNSTGSQLVIATKGELGIYDPKINNVIAQIPTNEYDKTTEKYIDYIADGLAFVPDNDDVLIAGLENGQVRLFNADKYWTRLITFKAATDVHSLSIAPDAKTILTGSFHDGQTRVWDIESLLKEKIVCSAPSHDGCLMQ